MTSAEPLKNQTIDEYLSLCLHLYHKDVKIDQTTLTLQVWSYMYTIYKSQSSNDITKIHLDFIDLIREHFKRQTSPGIDLDEHFIIRNRLPGYRLFLERLLTSDFTPLDESSFFATIESVNDLLISNYRMIFIFFQKLDNLETAIGAQHRMVEFFWTLFHSLKLNEKVEFIHLIETSSTTIRRERDGSISILYDRISFDNELVLAINKFSSENFENTEVLNF